MVDKVIPGEKPAAIKPEVKEATSQGVSITDKVRENPWVLSTFVLGIVALIFIISNFSGGLTGGAIGVASKDVVTQKVMTFINSQAGEGNVQYISTNLTNGLYEIVVKYQGTDVPIYVTADGKNLVQGVVPLDAVLNASDNGTGSTTSKPVDIPIGNSPVLGNPSAKLTIVEFSDFSCPYCGAASGLSADMVAAMKQRDPTWEPAVPGIIKDYVNTGKAKFVYKYSMGHTGGHPATLVGYCLNDQNLFWKFHDKAFADQADVENLTKMQAIAKSLGADMTKLNACLDAKKYDSKLDEDEALGQSIGIGGTPAIYANGIKVANGAESYTDVKKAIDAVLAQA